MNFRGFSPNLFAIFDYFSSSRRHSPLAGICADGTLLLEVLTGCEKVLVALAFQILKIDDHRLGNVLGSMDQAFVLGIFALLVTVGTRSLEDFVELECDTWIQTLVLATLELPPCLVELLFR